MNVFRDGLKVCVCVVVGLGVGGVEEDGAWQTGGVGVRRKSGMYGVGGEVKLRRGGGRKGMMGKGGVQLCTHVSEPALLT